MTKKQSNTFSFARVAIRVFALWGYISQYCTKYLRWELKKREGFAYGSEVLVHGHLLCCFGPQWQSASWRSTWQSRMAHPVVTRQLKDIQDEPGWGSWYPLQGYSTPLPYCFLLGSTSLRFWACLYPTDWWPTHGLGGAFTIQWIARVIGRMK